MDIEVTPEERAFRQEVRSFAQAHLPESVRRKVLYGEKLEKQEYVDWQRHLHRQGWIAPAWPVQYGGTGWSLGKQRIFLHELALQCAPETIPFGIAMVGPVIYTFGSDEQKTQYLPAILGSETWWCQGFSEPNAGSDLASLRTRAVDCGDHYLLNGQKAWTTHGRNADMMFCLARTSDTPKPQQGISFLLLDMKTPGIEVRPVRTIDEGASICEVFFNDVRVPKSGLVGKEGEGWTYAKFLLGHERAMIARVGRSRMQLARAQRLASHPLADGSRPIDNPIYRQRLCDIEARLRALELTELRALSAYRPGAGFDVADSSMLKIEGSEICQALTELLLDLAGRYGMVYTGRYTQSPIGDATAHGLLGDHLFNRVATIYGGSSEIQKTVIAKSRFQK
ncbi:acyl-CoA dehydrogenase family protein [Achromobacter denitrificans]|uniref:acyl-CoA dehydrogenase family protein n=1 Tax=Achromobacter denitrificans TaxID=32002 RepID=UPI000F68DEEB|nr:acyl-CoA dehydrogenase family protein [Achromobacter denitrificans]RSE85974.1 pimeloyl-CoA dehydrogenase large subunit [Achromobacter denitrificans]